MLNWKELVGREFWYDFKRDCFYALQNIRLGLEEEGVATRGYVKLIPAYVRRGV